MTRRCSPPACSSPAPIGKAKRPPCSPKHQPDLAFLPSIWPETWCFTLSEAWAAGLYAVVFDLGAQAERMRASRPRPVPAAGPAGPADQ